MSWRRYETLPNALEPLTGAFGFPLGRGYARRAREVLQLLANAWLAAEGIAAFNRRFAVAPAQPGSAFLPTTLDLERICTLQHERVVSNANTVQLGRRHLQIGPSRFRCHFVKCRVTVHEHLDETLSITYGPHLLGRYTAEGAALARRPRPDGNGGPMDGQRTVHRALDARPDAGRPHSHRPLFFT